MSNKENEKLADELNSTEKPSDVVREDLLADISGLISKEIPPGVDRRNFLIRSAVGGAAAVMGSLCLDSAGHREGTRNAASVAAAGGTAPPLAADLNVCRRARGPC